jgi:hypothetical protein
VGIFELRTIDYISRILHECSPLVSNQLVLELSQPRDKILDAGVPGQIEYQIGGVVGGLVYDAVKVRKDMLQLVHI